MSRVLHLDRGLLVGRVAVEVRPHQFAVPGPAVLGVGGGVDAGVAATGLDVALERRLLVGGQHVSGGGEPDDRPVLSEVRVGERGAVLSGVDGEAVLGAELLDGGDAGGDGGVAEAGGLGEDQHRERLGGGLRNRLGDGGGRGLCGRGREKHARGEAEGENGGGQGCAGTRCSGHSGLLCPCWTGVTGSARRRPSLMELVRTPCRRGPGQHLCRVAEQISSVRTINGKTSMDNVSVNASDIPVQPTQTATGAGPHLGRRCGPAVVCRRARPTTRE